ncbi:MAG TPA: peptidoglycan recognition family protein, partial [Caldisericia bacterium]|nr:peptidoglycan recognition family protein [Caldisericia bacterium]
WSISPYHFGIGKKGDIFNGQDENFFCIHAGDDYYNFRSLAVCFIGNFEVEEMNDNQLLSGVNLVKDLMKKYDISIEEILKHKDLIITQCPGKNFPWEKFTNKILDIPQYKYDSIEFGIKTGLIKNYHRPDEIVDFGTLLTILKNFYEVIKNG